MLLLLDDADDVDEDDDVMDEDGELFARLQSMEVDDAPGEVRGALLVAGTVGPFVHEPGPVGDEHELEPDDELVSGSSRSISVQNGGGRASKCNPEENQSGIGVYANNDGNVFQEKKHTPTKIKTDRPGRESFVDDDSRRESEGRR